MLHRDYSRTGMVTNAIAREIKTQDEKSLQLEIGTPYLTMLVSEQSWPGLGFIQVSCRFSPAAEPA